VAQRVDYDRLAPTYDARYEGDQRSGTGAALCALVEARQARDVLEVGCGTGHWLVELQRAGTEPRPYGDVIHSCERAGTRVPIRVGRRVRARPHGVRVYGLDLSSGMLCRARDKGFLLSLVRGRASQLPFAGATFDLVYCVNAIHHFDRPRAFIYEACHTLRPGGTLAVIGMDPREQRDTWYIYDYFEGIYERDLRRFPSWGTVMGWMAEEGLADVECRIVERFATDLVGWAVLSHPFLRKGSCSQLALLSDEAYVAGLRRIEAALVEAEAAGREIVFPDDVSLAMISGHRVRGDG
jgi:ubiquinone/menaquinone biosynthesis C-methylase UbiE